MMEGDKDDYVEYDKVTCGNFVVSGWSVLRIFKPECVSRQKCSQDVFRWICGFSRPKPRRLCLIRHYEYYVNVAP
jgi:hypothetical protein